MSHERVRRLGRRLRWLVTAMLAIVVAVSLGGLWQVVADPAAIAPFAARQYDFAAPLRSSGLSVAALVAIFALQAVPIVAALAALRCAFAQIAGGEMIGADTARWLRRAGWAFMANAAVMLASKPLVSLALSIDMPPGQRFLAIGVGTPELLALLVSGVLVMFGHLMAVATEIQDENRRFV